MERCEDCGCHIDEYGYCSNECEMMQDIDSDIELEIAELDTSEDEPMDYDQGDYACYDHPECEPEWMG